LDFEDKAAHRVLMWVNRARRCLARKRVWRPSRQAGEQLGHAEILQRAAEDDWRQMPFEEGFGVEWREVAEAQFEALQRRLRNAVLDLRMRIQSSNGRQRLDPAK